ncbi:MAG: hypothetical protein HND57_01035 [Planctomycetes bacterium]|nr:hypothetical protein [Planctomycetota bacterium]
MAYVIMFLVMVGFGGLGYWRGGLRLGLGLLPLVCATVLLWLFGGIAYRIDAFRNIGLVWPGLILMLLGLAAGYTGQFFLRRKLPKDRHQYDRIAGAAVGVFMAVVITWLGTVYYWVYQVSKQHDVSSTTTGLARTLNGGFVRWIPGVGNGSDAMMVLVDIASADEGVQQMVIADLGLDELRDLPEMQEVLNDAEIVDAIERMQNGNVFAFMTLQKHPLVLGLAENPDFMAAVERLSLKDIAESIRYAEEGGLRNEGDGDGGGEGGG